MRHKNSHLLVGYWSKLRRGRDVPDQTDIDPRAIKRVLSYVFILDAEDPSRPIYRLAGTGLCERFGFELKGTGFFAHWEAQSSAALGALLEQALKLKQPVCLTSVGASADCGMVELETVLASISFGPGGARRFVGMIQILSDASQLRGRPIAFQRLAASQLIREDEPVSTNNDLPPPPVMLRPHPRAPHLRLVVSQEKPAGLAFEAESIIERMFTVLGGGFSAG